MSDLKCEIRALDRAEHDLRHEYSRARDRRKGMTTERQCQRCWTATVTAPMKFCTTCAAIEADPREIERRRAQREAEIAEATVHDRERAITHEMAMENARRRASAADVGENPNAVVECTREEAIAYLDVGNKQRAQGARAVAAMDAAARRDR